MPIYIYQCLECQHRIEVQRQVIERDDPVYCMPCLFIPEMKRVPAAANFTVEGYNAKNGYSDD